MVIDGRKTIPFGLCSGLLVQPALRLLLVLLNTFAVLKMRV